MLSRRRLATALVMAPCIVVAPFARAAPGGAPGRADFPNVELLNQDGKTLRFYDDLIRGDHTVVMGFIYAQCGDICPMTMSNLARVQALLGDRLGREVRLASISLDPQRDSPAILKGYAERFDARLGWQFLTGRPRDIDAVRRKLGAYDRDPAIERDGMARKDTISLGPNSEVEVYVKFRDHRGPFVLHCHNMEHEDHAMMARFDVI
jgi:protein SCO1